MNKVFEYIGIFFISIIAYVAIYLGASWANNKATFIIENPPSTIFDIDEFKATVPFSAFLNDNQGFVDFIMILPLICLVASIVFFVRQQKKWGFLMIGFPCIFVLPMLVGVELEWRNLNKSMDSMLEGLIMSGPL